MVLKIRDSLVAGVVMAATLLAACSTDRGADEFFAPGGAGIPVVDATLVVGDFFPDVFLTRTLAPNEPFSREKAAIRGAQVRIDGVPNMPYVEDRLTPGEYHPVPFGPGSDLVLPGTTYRLVVDLPDGTRIRATTTTPERIRVRDWVLLDDAGSRVVQEMSTFADHGDSVYEQPENQLAFGSGLVEIRLEDAPAAAYQIGLLSLDLDSPLLIDTDFLDQSTIDRFSRANHSPPLVTTTTSIRVPWFAIIYEGRYILRVFAMDRNYFDLARTDPVLGGSGFGFGGEAGDNSNRPVFHVEGGIGLFGSVSSDSVGFYVHPPAP